MLIRVARRLRNKAEFNRSTSFLVDILIFDRLALPFTSLLARLPWMTPNMVTGASGILGVGAAVLYSQSALALGAATMFVSMLLDCVDGNLARLTGQTSEFGAKLDQTFDTLKKALCLVALVSVSAWPLWATIAIVVAHYVLQRLYAPTYPETFRFERFTRHRLEPFFEPYDLLFLLVCAGPPLDFEIVALAVLAIQVIIGAFSRSRPTGQVSV